MCCYIIYIRTVKQNLHIVMLFETLLPILLNTLIIIIIITLCVLIGDLNILISIKNIQLNLYLTFYKRFIL